MGSKRFKDRIKDNYAIPKCTRSSRSYDRIKSLRKIIRRERTRGQLDFTQIHLVTLTCFELKIHSRSKQTYRPNFGCVTSGVWNCIAKRFESRD